MAVRKIKRIAEQLRAFKQLYVRSRPWSILLTILVFVFCTDTGVIMVQHANMDIAIRDNNGGISSSEPICEQSKLGCVKPISSSTPLPDSPAPLTQPTSSSSSAAVMRSSATLTPASTPDISAAAAASAKYDQCNSANNIAGDKYYAASQQADAAYDKVIADGNKAIEETYYWMNIGQKANLRLGYLNDAKSEYNAISIPAYGEYSNTLSSLRSLGCKIVQVFSDTSWK